MAIITIGGVDFQSYVSVAEATDYFLGRVHDENWLAQETADPEVLDKSLITATQLLDDFEWSGYSTEEDQPLAWPRVGSIVSRRLGRTISFDSTAEDPPLPVRRACMELAYHLVQNTDVLNNSSSVNGLVVGALELMDVKKEPLVPQRIRNMVSDYLIRGNRNWYRSN